MPVKCVRNGRECFLLRTRQAIRVGQRGKDTYFVAIFKRAPDHHDAVAAWLVGPLFPDAAFSLSNWLDADDRPTPVRWILCRSGGDIILVARIFLLCALSLLFDRHEVVSTHYTSTFAYYRFNHPRICSQRDHSSLQTVLSLCRWRIRRESCGNDSLCRMW